MVYSESKMVWLAVLSMMVSPAEVWYGPATVAFDLRVAGSPYDAESNDVRVEFTAGERKEIRLAFFDGKSWRATLLARHPGRYQANVIVNGRRETGLSTPVLLDDGGIRPFVRIGESKRGFYTADGKPYWPVGHNLGWQGGNDLPSLTEQLAEMARNGCNWARIWSCNWDGKNPYWVEDKTLSDPRGMFPEVLDRWETIVRAADRAGVKFQWVLFNHGSFSSRTDPNWPRHPWNSANGGFLNRADDFFTHPEAKRRTKNWLRYVVARWGHEPTIMAWELFNEVEWVDAIANGSPETVGRWHDEMARYLRELDPYRRLVTTSSGMHLPIWKEMDYYQPHGYPPDVRALVMGTAPTKDKPMFYGEVGIGGSGGGPNEGWVVRDALWSGLMAGHAGAAQYWYWDRVARQRLYPDFKRYSDFLTTHGLAQGARYTPVKVEASSRKAGAVSFAAGQGWAPTRQYVFKMPEDAFSGALGQLSSFIQGPAKRDMMAEPIRFEFEAESPGRFEMTVATVARQGAEIRLLLNGEEKVKEAIPASERDNDIRRTYGFEFGAGKNVVTVANGGADWYNVSSFKIDGIGVAVSVGASMRQDQILARLQRHAEGPAEESFGLAGLPADWKSAAVFELDLLTGQSREFLVLANQGTVSDLKLAAKDAVWLLKGQR